MTPTINEIESEKRIASMLRKSWLYTKMADDLRAQAAKEVWGRKEPAPSTAHA